MNLNAEQLAVLVRTLNQETEETSAEKRRATRACHPGSLTIILCQPPVDSAAEASPEADDARETACVRIANLSSRGIAMLHSQPLAPGQRFMIQLPRQIDHHVHIVCTVVHCTPQGEGLYNVGAEFTGVVPAGTFARHTNRHLAHYA